MVNENNERFSFSYPQGPLYDNHHAVLNPKHRKSDPHGHAQQEEHVREVGNHRHRHRRGRHQPRHHRRPRGLGQRQLWRQLRGPRGRGAALGDRHRYLPDGRHLSGGIVELPERLHQVVAHRQARLRRVRQLIVRRRRHVGRGLPGFRISPPVTGNVSRQ